MAALDPGGVCDEQPDCRPTRADPAPRCFQNISLHATYTVRLTTTGDQVRGTFIVAPDSGDNKEYPFTGTRNAQRLGVKFAGA